jgi:type II restriction/modification system DNA methylase subunit YeeA
MSKVRLGTHTRHRDITGKDNADGCYNDSLIHASNHEHAVHKGMKLTMKKDTIAESTILLWFQSAYVLRIKKPAYFQLGTCIC